MLMILLQAVPAPDLINWLVQQAPVVVVMGAAIYWLAKKLNKAEKDKDELAKDVIKLTTLWEEKSDKLENNNSKVNEINSELSKQIIDLLKEIKVIVSNK